MAKTTKKKYSLIKLQKHLEVSKKDDFVEILDGKKIVPRCPKCHQKLLNIYSDKVIWKDGKYQILKIYKYLQAYKQYYCPCGENISDVVKIKKEEDD
jgi:hypothetical protein